MYIQILNLVLSKDRTLIDSSDLNKMYNQIFRFCQKTGPCFIVQELEVIHSYLSLLDISSGKHLL